MTRPYTMYGRVGIPLRCRSTTCQWPDIINASLPVASVCVPPHCNAGPEAGEAEQVAAGRAVRSSTSIIPAAEEAALPAPISGGGLGGPSAAGGGCGSRRPCDEISSDHMAPGPFTSWMNAVEAIGYVLMFLMILYSLIHSLPTGYRN